MLRRSNMTVVANVRVARLRFIDCEAGWRRQGRAASAASCVVSKRLQAERELLRAAGPQDEPQGDRMTVLDSRLRCHDARGLRMADASMPRIASRNANSPTLTIAEKGVE